jgi:transcriptional regulator with XRE-family HTH domain
MNRDKPDDSTLAFPVLSIFRGLYQRVAGKLGVDPSYVSRVARGERKSAVVLAALQEEMDAIREHLNQQSRDGRAQGDVPEGELNGGQHADGQLAKGRPTKSARKTANGHDAKAAN